jgi:hypothetical protein
MALILNKIGITTGNTVEAYHVTQSIDAFTGIKAYDISLSGSFNMTGSLNAPTITGSLHGTASYALNAGSGVGFPFSGSAVITGSLLISGSGLTVSGSTTLRGNTTLTNGTITITGSAGNTEWVASRQSIINWSQAGTSGDIGTLVLPSAETNTPKTGSIYYSSGELRVWTGTNWIKFTPTP